MSTSVIRPGAASRQTPSGKTFGLLVAGMAVAIALGFAFYTSQSNDITVSGSERTPGPTVTDTWLVNRQNAVNAANDVSAAYESARIAALAQAYAGSQTSTGAASIIEQSIQDALAATRQAQVEAQSEAFGIGELFAASRVMQAWSDRLTGLASAGEIMNSQPVSAPSTTGSGHPLTVPVSEVNPGGPVNDFRYR